MPQGSQQGQTRVSSAYAPCLQPNRTPNTQCAHAPCPPPAQITAYAGGISAALGPNIFTDLAFESTAGRYAPEDSRRLFASSAAGAVFEIDYNTWVRPGACVRAWRPGVCVWA